MSEQDDQVFLKRFSLIIAGLAVFAVVLVFAGIQMNNRLAVSDNPAKGEATVQRIKPIFAVYTSESEQAATQAAAEQTGDAQEQQAAVEAADDSQQQQVAAEEADDSQEEQATAEETDDSQQQMAAEEGDDSQQQQAAAEEAADSEQQQVAFGGSMDGEMIYNSACQACHMSGAAGAPLLVAAQWEDRLDKGKDTLVSHAINGFNAMPAKGGRPDLSDEQVRASVEYMLAEIE